MQGFTLFFSEEFYEAKMQEQRAELDHLMDERRKLLSIQEQLQRLYEQLPGVSTGGFMKNYLESVMGAL